MHISSGWASPHKLLSSTPSGGYPYPLRGWPVGGETVYGCAEAACSAALARRGWESCQEEAERKDNTEGWTTRSNDYTARELTQMHEQREMSPIWWKGRQYEPRLHQIFVQMSPMKTTLTCTVARMAFSNSLYASHTVCPLVMWSPTAVIALSKTDLTLSMPPGEPMPPMEYWAYSSQISGPEWKKKTLNLGILLHLDLESLLCQHALTNVVFYSLFKKFINFFSVWFLFSHANLILEPV